MNDMDVEDSENEPLEPGEHGDESPKKETPIDRVKERIFSVNWWKDILVEDTENDTTDTAGILYYCNDQIWLTLQ